MKWYSKSKRDTQNNLEVRVVSRYIKKKKIFNFLLKRYKKKGKNFYFRSSQLSRELNIPPCEVGKVCKSLYMDNLIECYNKYCRNSSKVWKTVFSG